MDAYIEFAAVAMITIVALFSALALQALLLRATFALMEPATAGRRVTVPGIERGTRMVAHAYAKGR